LDGESSPTKEGYANESLIAYTLAVPNIARGSRLSDLFAPLKRPPQIAKEHDRTTGLIAPPKRGKDNMARYDYLMDALPGFSAPRSIC
jgi:hypothetical protein